MKHKLLIVCILSIVMLVSGCTITNQFNTNQNTSVYNKFVAVREIIRENGTVISGYYPFQRNIDPGYAFWYNKSIEPYPNESVPNPYKVKILLTIYKYINTPEQLQVWGVDDALITELPYTLQTGIVISGVNDNGTLILSFNSSLNNSTPGSSGNTSISIPPGTTWTSPVFSIWNDTENSSINPPNATWDPNVMNYNYTIQHVFTCTVENNGVFD